MADQVKQLTRKSIYGRWNFRSEDKNIYVVIDPEEVQLVFCDPEDNVLSEEYFSPEAHWVNDYLCFNDAEEKYFVGYANRAKMSFGEFSTPGVPGNVKWIHVFSRT
jgi:hypothetical protein